MVRAPRGADPKATRDGAAPMEEAAAVVPPQPSGGEPTPAKPKFAPLSAYEQSGKRMEFRRVSCYM